MVIGGKKRQLSAVIAALRCSYLWLHDAKEYLYLPLLACIQNCR
jgi:hypothetical protein